MRKILVIGIGAGHPDQVTVQAIDALNRADVIFIPDKGAEKAELRRLRREICDRFIKDRNYRTVEFAIPKRAVAGDDYGGAVRDWHAALASAYGRLFTEELGEDACGAILVWGDPALYDGTLRILEALKANGYDLGCEVIPGVSAVNVLAASYKIALNRIGRPVLITTGRQLAQGFPRDVDDVVVLLDGDCAFTQIDPAGIDIYWGAYLGTPEEILVAGKLAEVSADIVRIRSEARAAHGWIMDTYLLRKRDGL